VSSTNIIIASQAHYVTQYKKPVFKLTKCKILVFDNVHILFHFNIIPKHKVVSSTKKHYTFIACLVEKYKSQTLFCVGYGAAHISIHLPTVRYKLLIPPSTYRLSRNVGNYQYTMRNAPEERTPHLNRGGSLKSHSHSTFLLYQ